jgi:AraC-like DNA-binding protein
VSYKPQARYAALTGYGALSDSLGLDWPPLMRSAGLDPAGLAVQDRWIPAAAVARLLEISAVASGQEDFGLRLAEYRRLANLGPLALVIREEPDVRSVLQMLIRYEHTYNQALNIRLAETEGLATIRMDLEFGEPVGTRQATELAVGALHRLHRQLHGARWQPLSMCLPHPAPADISTHLRVFGRAVEFQREFAGIVLRASDLAAPNEIADPLLRPYAHQFLDTIEPPADVTMVARVRELIEVLLPTGHCSIVEVARSLGVDRRTVQRRLAGSGETFSSLLNAVRAELAERLVPNPRRSLTEIAEELGFSDPSAFSRWFRGQFGCSPKAWRSRSQLGAQALSKHLDQMPRLRAGPGTLAGHSLGMAGLPGRARDSFCAGARRCKLPCGRELASVEGHRVAGSAPP